MSSAPESSRPTPRRGVSVRGAGDPRSLARTSLAETQAVANESQRVVRALEQQAQALKSIAASLKRIFEWESTQTSRCSSYTAAQASQAFMRVDVQITIEDFRAFCKAAYKRAQSLPPPSESNPWRRRLLAGFAFFGVVLVDLVAIRLTDGPIVQYFLFGGLLALPFCGFFVYSYVNAQHRMQPEESGAVLGRKSFELTENGVVEVSPQTESITRWAGVMSVEETPEHIFLFVDRSAAFIIPKRCFGAPDEAAEFSAFAEDHAKHL